MAQSVSEDPNRNDAPRCPECGRPAHKYEVMWDYHICPNGHRWNGPINGGPPVSALQKRV